MALRTIRTWPDPVLKETCAPVVTFDAALHALLDDLVETMYNGNGIGLAANQVAEKVRVFVADVPLPTEEGEEPRSTGVIEIVNPTILARRGEVRVEEGCLSFPGVNENVNRSAEIDVEFQDREGRHKRLTARGLVAICIQHEFDHLDGITFIDRLSPLKRRLAMKSYARAQAERALEDMPEVPRIKVKRREASERGR